MDSFEETRTKIFAEITTDDPEVREEYLTRFETQAKEFSEVMAQVMQAWLKEHGDAQGNETRLGVPLFSVQYLQVRKASPGAGSVLQPVD